LQRTAGAPNELTLLMTGDLILDEPDPDSYFDLARDVLKSADVLVGHVEVPFTDQPVEYATLNPGRETIKLQALGRAGVHVATLGANHIYDAGPEGIADTVAALRAQGIQTAGAGMSLDEARLPALVERNGIRVGVLSYNCAGPRTSWASATKAGCAYVHALTHYEEALTIAGPARVYSFADFETLEWMEADIVALRPRVDVLVVAFHKGVVHTPALVAMYERQVARAAVNAGADVVISHHAHITRGMEVYKGKPIYHGLGNFVTLTRVLNLTGNPNPQMLEYARRRREVYGFEPDPEYPTYPFHPESKNAIVAYCKVGKDGVREAGFQPFWITPSGAPEPRGRDELGQSVARYIEDITRQAKLNGQFRWDGDRVLFFP
jgi:hypothetical protein